MTNSHPEILIHDDRSRRRALEILRNRMFGGSKFSPAEIQQAVLLVQDFDPAHPLLVSSEHRSLEQNRNQ